MNHKEIHDSSLSLQRDRLLYMQKVMKEYDESYNYKIKQLQEECSKLGHVSNNNIQDNGLGYYWTTCIHCNLKLYIKE